MRMTAPPRHQDADGFTQPQDLAVQRECAQCEEDEELPQKKEPPGQAAPVSDDSQDVPPVVHEVLRSPGQPLDPSTRAFFEPRFGRDIVFGAGEYALGTTAGQRLLVHELAHMVQQAPGAGSLPVPPVIARAEDKRPETVRPDLKEIVAYHSNGKRVKNAKLAAPHDLESKPWTVTDAAVTGLATVDPNKEPD